MDVYMSYSDYQKACEDAAPVFGVLIVGGVLLYAASKIADAYETHKSNKKIAKNLHRYEKMTND